MVDRRRLARLKAAVHRDGIVIELKDGGTEVFPQNASFDFITSCWAEGVAEDKGEEFTPDPEYKRLKRALENATPESREEFYAKYTPAVAWEEECPGRNANEGAE